MWILGATPTRFYALIFNGSAWHTIAAPTAGMLVVGGPSNVWIYQTFGARSGREVSVTSDLYRWNGKKWTFTIAPTLGLGLAVSGHRVWLAGTTKVHFENDNQLGVTRPRLYRFSAGAWHPASAAGPKAVIATNMSAAAVSPSGNIWLAGRGKRGAGGRILQYRFGKWTSTVISRNGPVAPFNATFDGKTGFWDAWFHWTGSRMISTEDQNQRVALDLAEIVPIPHSSNAWARAGIGDLAGHGAIARYGG